MMGNALQIVGCWVYLSKSLPTTDLCRSETRSGHGGRIFYRGRPAPHTLSGGATVVVALRLTGKNGMLSGCGALEA